MSTQELSALLRRHPFCAEMDPEHLALMSGCAINRRYAPGERLFRMGQAAERTWLIRAGRVALEIGGPGQSAHRLETAEAGELVGWSWLFPPYRWHFDAVALGSVRALELDGTCLRAKCEADPAFGFDLTRRILYQAQQKLERSRMQALDIFGAGR